MVDHYTYVIAGDGCLMEGISHEAISLAGHLGLGRLIVLFDDNSISIDGGTNLSVDDDQLARFKASKWHVQAIDGHDPEAIARAIEAAKKTAEPSLIACKTVIGKGAPTKAGTASTHGSPLGAKEIEGARAQLGWNAPPFSIPEPILAEWRKLGGRGAKDFDAWTKRHGAANTGAEFDRVIAGELPEAVAGTIQAFKKDASEKAQALASRQSSGNTLDALAPVMPELIGGSADLTGSNNTKAKSQAVIKKGAYGGAYIHYGVREHGMAAAMNGMALHGGVIPYGGTFLTFTDYCRPSIRLSALMGIRVVYVMTHDSIGLGEDGPTHQPVEHLAALRCIPNLHVFRPVDTVETAECWALALASAKTPSILVLTRQALPTVRTTHTEENRSARGAYVLAEASGARKATLIATGSEVSIATKAREMLETAGVPTAVVSMPCWSLFDAQPESYRNQVLGSGVRVAIEAGVKQGWERYIGDKGAFIGMAGFGASAPAEALYKHFGITAEATVSAVKARIG
jgi:transketolase